MNDHDQGDSQPEPALPGGVWASVDPETYLDSAAGLAGLIVTPGQRPGVMANLLLAGEMAARVLAVPLPELDLAGVYTPPESR